MKRLICLLLCCLTLLSLTGCGAPKTAVSYTHLRAHET